MNKTKVDSVNTPADPASDTIAPAAPRRIDRLAEIVDLCTEARGIAQGLNEPLLAYLLAMAIQETRAGMRQQVAASAGNVKLATRRGKARRVPV